MPPFQSLDWWELREMLWDWCERNVRLFALKRTCLHDFAAQALNGDDWCKWKGRGSELGAWLVFFLFGEMDLMFVVKIKMELLVLGQEEMVREWKKRILFMDETLRAVHGSFYHDLRLLIPKVHVHSLL